MYFFHTIGVDNYEENFTNYVMKSDKYVICNNLLSISFYYALPPGSI